MRSFCPRFIRDRGSVPDPGVQGYAVVVRQVASQALRELGRGREGVAVDGIALQRVEERLHVRDLPGPVYALHEAEGGEAIAEGIGRILDATVAVEDEAGARPPIARAA